MEDMCTVVLDGENVCSDDFIAVIVKPDGDPVVYVSTDTLTIGMTAIIMQQLFANSMDLCTPEERKEVLQALSQFSAIDSAYGMTAEGELQ